MKATDPKMMEYWNRNVGYMKIFITIWFFCSFGAGIIFFPILGGLGFWFAQQGAILIFLALIWAYVFVMNKLDQEYGLNE
jgi:putative solute:sodium symporter small subunit